MPTASLHKGKTPNFSGCPGYDTASDGEAPILGFQEKWSKPSLPLLPGPL